ncbi:MAG: hypothetical protein RLZZ28_1521 [Bacteroidota bacterium]|jgi:uncharacterized membrane protein
MCSFFKRKPVNYFSTEEQQLIVEAIQQAEHRTSGEVRIFVESHCTYVDPVRRAKEVFNQLNMHTTAARNGVLLYVAMKDRQLAIFGDEGIHEKVGNAFWNEEVTRILTQFNKNNYSLGISEVIRDIGEALTLHFPYDAKTDRNELPDDIVFGK